MNARLAIEQRAEQHGWSRIIGNDVGEIWARGEDRIAIRYKMFGTLRNGVGWGVELAMHGGDILPGKNKKGQILRLLATPLEGEQE